MTTMLKFVSSTPRNKSDGSWFSVWVDLKAGDRGQPGAIEVKKHAGDGDAGTIVTAGYVTPSGKVVWSSGLVPTEIAERLPDTLRMVGFGRSVFPIRVHVHEVEEFEDEKE